MITSNELQMRWLRPFGRSGGFDSLSLPPFPLRDTARVPYTLLEVLI